MNNEYNRKVNQTGSDLTFSIPLTIANQLDIQKGDDVSIIFDSTANGFVVKKKTSLPKGVRLVIIPTLDKVIGRYGKTLGNLR